MAIYHLTAKVYSRSAGRSAVACAAYRSRDRLTDERTGETWDYRKKGPEESEILAPEKAPGWAQDREQLWNHAEACEKRKDAQVAREIEVALPKELSPEQQRELVREFARENFVERGVVVDAAYHRSNEENPHAHLLITTRPVGEEGFGKKDREMNSKEALEGWRESWERDTNRALERAGREERIDRRSLKEQGILDREPTKHEGPHVRAMEERGERTELGEYNRAVREHNGNVIDFQKAKEEVERLRPVHERHQERMKEGYWSQEGSQAVARLEERQNRPVSREEAERGEIIHGNDYNHQSELVQSEKKRRDSLRGEIAERQKNLAEHNHAAKEFERENGFLRRTEARLKLKGEEHDQRLAALADRANRAWADYRGGAPVDWEGRLRAGTPPEGLERRLRRTERSLKDLELKEARAREEAQPWQEAGVAWRGHDWNRAERDLEIARRHEERLQSCCYYPGEAEKIREAEGREGRAVTREYLYSRHADTASKAAAHYERERELEAKALKLDTTAQHAERWRKEQERVTRELQERNTFTGKAKRLISPGARREYEQLQQRGEQARAGLQEYERRHGTSDPGRLREMSHDAKRDARHESALGANERAKALEYQEDKAVMDRALERGRYREMSPGERTREFGRGWEAERLQKDMKKIEIEVTRLSDPKLAETMERQMERAAERALEQARGRNHGYTRSR